MCAEDALDIRGLKWEDSLWQVSFLIIFEVHRVCVCGCEREREEGDRERKTYIQSEQNNQDLF